MNMHGYPQDIHKYAWIGDAKTIELPTIDYTQKDI